MNQKMQQKSDNKSGNSPEINHKSIKTPSPEEAFSKEPASQDYISHLFSYTSAVGGAETPSERFSSLLTGPGFSHPANSNLRNQTFIQMQQTFGNDYVQRMVGKSRNSNQEPGTRIQAKLKIGQPNDIYEQEAERIADQVMRMPEPKESLVQRKSTCPECLEEEEILQTREVSGRTLELTPSKESRIHRAMSGGQSLPESVRAYFEPRFSYDFSKVRIHTGAKAEESARQINALAYTVGHDIVAGAGQFAPETMAGRRLLAHELTHVVQQEAAGTLAVQANEIGQTKVYTDCDCIMEAFNNVNAADKALELAKEKTKQTQADLEDAMALAGVVCVFGLGSGAGVVACGAAVFNVRSKIRSFEAAAKAQISAEETQADAELKLDLCEEECGWE